MDRCILVEREGPIATVVLNRPEKLNALTKSMWRGLGEVITELSADHELRCIVLRGAGERSFSPGNDISEFETERHDVASARAYGDVMHLTLSALHRCPHPMIALIHGVCVGGGLELAAHCDIRICGAASRFGVPINRLGLVMSPPELGGLLALVGRANTLEILLEGRVFGAEEAKEKGLVSRVVPDDEVESEAYASARRVAEGAPLVARWHKKFINRLGESSALGPQELEEGFACFGTEDFQIGRKAFLAKSRPEFVGR